MTIRIEPFLLHQQTIIYKNPFQFAEWNFLQITEQKSYKSPNKRSSNHRKRLFKILEKCKYSIEVVLEKCNITTDFSLEKCNLLAFCSCI